MYGNCSYHFAPFRGCTTKIEQGLNYSRREGPMRGVSDVPTRINEPCCPSVKVEQAKEVGVGLGHDIKGRGQGKEGSRRLYEIFYRGKRAICILKSVMSAKPQGGACMIVASCLAEAAMQGCALEGVAH